MKKIFNVSILCFSVFLLTSCNIFKENHNSVIKQSDDSVNDYFVEDSKDINVDKESKVGNVDFQFDNDQNYLEIKMKEEKSYDKNEIVIYPTGFSEEKIFIYIDDVLIETVNGDVKNISVNLSSMVFGIAPGVHKISLVQYENQNEDNKIINKVSKEYKILSEKN